MQYSKHNKAEMLHTLRSNMKISSVLISIPIMTFCSFGVQFYSLWVPSLDAKALTILSLLTCIGIHPKCWNADTLQCVYGHKSSEGEFCCIFDHRNSESWSGLLSAGAYIAWRLCNRRRKLFTYDCPQSAYYSSLYGEAVGIAVV